MQHLLHLTVAPYSVLLDPVAFFFFSLPQPLCAKTLAFLFNRRLCRQSSKVCPVLGFLYPGTLSKSSFTASFLDVDLLVGNDIKQGDYVQQYSVVANVAITKLLKSIVKGEKGLFYVG